MRLLNKAQFAKEIGVSRQAIYKVTSPGGQLWYAMKDGKIDCDHESAKAFAAKHKAMDTKQRKAPWHNRPIEPDAELSKPEPVTEVVLARMPDPEPEIEPEPRVLMRNDPQLEEYKDGSRDIREMEEKPIAWAMERFSSAGEMKQWLECVSQIEKIHDQRLKNYEREGDLVNRHLIRVGITNPVDECFTKLLTDGAKAIAVTLDIMSKSGDDTIKMEECAVEIMTKLIKPAKERMIRALGKMEE